MMSSLVEGEASILCDGLDVGDEWRGKSLLSVSDVSRRQFDAVLDLAAQLKRDRRDAALPMWSVPRTLVMLSEKPSLRTRVSFEAGMAQLGGHSIYLSPSDVGMGTRETAADIGAALSRWVDLIAARVFSHVTVVELANAATIPVINALSEVEHPCQAFADLFTIRERVGRLGPGLRLAYIGDGNNVLHSTMLACALYGIDVIAACPDGYAPDPAIVQRARSIAGSASSITLTTDPNVAAEGADILYTDVWASMGQEEEAVERAKAFDDYCINDVLVARASSDVIVLHCLPAHRGEEISHSVMDRFQNVILDQAENRLHTQKALIALILGSVTTGPPAPRGEGG